MDCWATVQIQLNSVLRSLHNSFRVGATPAAAAGEEWCQLVLAILATTSTLLNKPHERRRRRHKLSCHQ